jgi:hypothetical protein
MREQRVFLISIIKLERGISSTMVFSIQPIARGTMSDRGTGIICRQEGLDFSIGHWS